MENQQETFKVRKKKYKPGRSHFKMKPGDYVFNIINYTVFAIFTLICLFPFYYLFINTISDIAYSNKCFLNWTIFAKINASTNSIEVVIKFFIGFRLFVVIHIKSPQQEF